MKKIFFLLITCLSFNFGFCGTWSEPSQKEIYEKSDFFILCKIVSSSAKKLKVIVVKNFGSPINGEIEINNYFLLDLCSSSGENDNETDFPEFKENDLCYFFVKKNKDNTFSLPTPTSGFAYTSENKVSATYRNSFVTVIISQVDYELTTQSIFNYYHNKSYEKDKIQKYVLEYLSKKPVELINENSNIIMNQHVALETIYHLGLKIDAALIYPFLDTKSLHYIVSAARSLRLSKSVESEKKLLQKIESSDESNYIKVTCIEILKGYKPKKLKKKLKELSISASEESIHFVNIMDPRICTSLPSVKEYLLDLIDSI